MKKVYLIGSLRNPEIPQVGNKIRSLGYDCFDDWFAAGPEADDYWRDYERARGHDLRRALRGYAAGHVFGFDKEHLDSSDIGVLVLPAGKSGHLELGYLSGRGRDTYIVYPEEPERFDVMYKFATDVFSNLEDLYDTLSTNS